MKKPIKNKQSSFPNIKITKISWLNNVLNFLHKYYFIIIIICAIILKHIITINLPIDARDPMGADEYLMMYQAEQLTSGNYLGPYNYLTLAKGIGFPLFLAISYKIGIPLLSFYSIFYTIACLIALFPIRRIIKNRPLQLIAFLLLLFCPASMDNNVQLIYRNMLIIPQSMLLISSVMMMFYHINDNDKKKLILWSLSASFTWVFMWHTREDTIWSIPLLITSFIILLFQILKNRQTNFFSKPILSKLLIALLPFIFLFSSIHIISLTNYIHYGIYTTNQLNNSNYTKAVMLIMKVKPTQEIEHVEITHDTLLRLYEISPSLATLKDTIEYDYEHNSGLVAAYENNGEVNEDLITWVLTGAANAKGYYQEAQTAENFWHDVYEEINSAINQGKLETRVILPSRSLIPYPNQPDSFNKLLGSIIDLYIRAAKYEDSIIAVNKSNVDELTTLRYEAISGGYAIRNTQSTNTITNPSESRALRWTNYANKIKALYALIGPFLLCISIGYYIKLTITVIIMAIKKKPIRYFDRWLFLSAIFGSLAVMLIGLGYVNAFMTNVNGYISSCNGLLNMFIAISTVLLIQDIITAKNSIQKKKCRHKNHKSTA